MPLEDFVTIQIDTSEPQEHLGHMFKRFKWERANLFTGDYGIKGFSDEGDPRFVIELKGLDDLVGSIKCSTERGEDFRNEIKRMIKFQCRAIVVWAYEEEVDAHNYRSQMSSRSVKQLIRMWSFRYAIPVFWAGDKKGAAELIEDLVWLFCKKLEDDAKKLGMDRRARKPENQEFAEKETEE